MPLAVSCISHSVSLCACVRKVMCACVRVCACPSDVRSSEPRRLARRRRRPRGAPSLWHRRARAPAPARRARRSAAVQRTRKTVSKTAAMCCRYAPACSMRLCCAAPAPHPIPSHPPSPSQPAEHPAPVACARASQHARAVARTLLHACACTRLWARGDCTRPPRWVGWRGPVWLRGYAPGAALRARARAACAAGDFRARGQPPRSAARIRLGCQSTPDGRKPNRPIEKIGSKPWQSLRSQTTCEKHVGGWGPTRAGEGGWRGGGAVVWHTAGETSARTTQSRVIDTLAAGGPRGGGVALAWGRRCGVAHTVGENRARTTQSFLCEAHVACPVRERMLRYLSERGKAARAAANAPTMATIFIRPRASASRPASRGR